MPWRFPLLLACVILVAASAMWTMHHKPSEVSINTAQKILLITIALAPVLFALKTAEERLGSGWRFLQIVAVAAGIASWWMLPANLNHTYFAFWFSWFSLAATLCLLVTVLPYAQKGQGGFWTFNRALLLRGIEAGIYAGILCAGLEVAFLSADKLFAIKFPGNIYGDIFVLCATLFYPVFFLAGILPMETYENDTSFPRILKVFTLVVLAPLCAIYAGILYIYALKIVILHRWPDGWVALPILVFSFIGILAWFLMSPLRDREEEPWARWFCANFPRILAPLTLLLLLSLRIRIHEYGFTEFRVVGIGLGFWLLAFSLFYSIPRMRDLRMVPASLFILGMLLSFGPFSASTISKKSQNARLEALFSKVKNPSYMAVNEGKAHSNFKDTVFYLLKWHGESSLPSDIIAAWQKWREAQKGRAENLVKDYSWRNSHSLSEEIYSSVFSAPAVTTTNGIQGMQIQRDFTKPLSPSPSQAVYISPRVDSITDDDGKEQVGPFVFSIKKSDEKSDEIVATTVDGGKAVDISPVNALIASLFNENAAKKGKPASGESILSPEKLSTTFSFHGENYTFVIDRLYCESCDSDLAIETINFFILKQTATP